MNPRNPLSAVLLLAASCVGGSSTRFEDRLIAASEVYLGRPYLLGPMGEGDSALGDPLPRVREDSLDCVTFLEHVEARARAFESGDILSWLDAIRYRDGVVGWAERNHFFAVEWIPRASAARRIRVIAPPRGHLVRRTVGFERFYGARGVSRADSVVELRVWTLAEVDSIARDPRRLARVGGISWIGKVEWLFSLHTGMWVTPSEGGSLRLRHASRTARSVVDEDLVAYVHRQKARYVGAILWEWLPAPP